MKKRFSPSSSRKFSNIIEGMSLAFICLLAFIGTMTLGIGAVGLANIMLTSVIERTREIGIMKAVGARRRSILCQFLMESIFIVMVGGALGLGLGALVTSVLGSLPAFGALLGEQFSREYGRIHFHISASAVITSLGILSGRADRGSHPCRARVPDGSRQSASL